MTLVSELAQNPLTEDFTNAQGRFSNYAPYDVTLKDKIRDLAHIDIRSFVQEDTVYPNNVFGMTGYNMTTLNARHMNELASGYVWVKGEKWTAGEIAKQIDRNNLRGLSLSLNIGDNQSESVMTPLDIQTGFADDDFISIALPNFPLSSINTTNSYIDFTSAPDGNFAVGPTASVAFSESITTLINGDSEFRFLRSSLNQIDISRITGVRLRINASASDTLRILGIRLLSKNWTYGGQDVNTQLQQFERVPSLVGNLTGSDFTWPIVWRSGNPDGPSDPRFVDGEFAAIFNTGSATATNRFKLFFRELTQDYLTQLDLDNKTMETLDGKHQPTIGDAFLNPRIQTDLDLYTQDQLTGDEQTTLESQPDYLSASWIEFVIEWGLGKNSITIQDSEGNGNLFVPADNTLLPNSHYIFIVSIQETTVRARIYKINDDGSLMNPVLFDTSTIDNDFNYKRRQGRFGWISELADGDAAILDIRSRSINFAEYKSRPLLSFTPVLGAQLFVSGSSKQELFTGFSYGPSSTFDTVTIDRDKSRTLSGESYRIMNPGNSFQGVQTNIIDFKNWNDTEIHLDVFVAASALANGFKLRAFLQQITTGTYVTDIILPKLRGDQWNHIRIKLPTVFERQNGPHRVILLQTDNTPNTWWIDNTSIRERKLRWEARSVVNDPWDSNDASWVPFEDNINSESGGIIFPQRGTELQVRGQANSQDAYLEKVKVKPRYTELGRLVTEEQPKGLVQGVIWQASANLGGSSGGFASYLPVYNYVLDPNFEYDELTTPAYGWNRSNTDSAIVFNEFSVFEVTTFSGTRSLFLDAVNTTSGDKLITLHMMDAITQRVPALVNQNWTVAAKVNITDTSDSVSLGYTGGPWIGLAWYDVNGTKIGESETGAGQDGSIGIHTPVLNITAPVNTASVIPFLRNGIRGKGGNSTFACYIDAVMLIKGSWSAPYTNPGYFDGDTTLYKWSGLPGKSTTVMANL